MRFFAVLIAGVIAGCTGTQLDPASEVIHARFDPDKKVIPMPTDILRDAELGRLDIPLDDDDLTDAEREFFTFLNERDGWSTTMAATIEFTAPVAPGTIDPDTLQVWHWRETPELVSGARITLDDTETKITIDAPREGWERGGKYVVMLRGGNAGVEGKRGEPVDCDAAFYFLRQTEKLDVAEHERAFPGGTRLERQDNARKLEEIRTDLEPFFNFFGERGVPRQEVASLWSFTVTERVELAMDKSSQRMPIPINLLVDTETGMIDLPVAEWDSEVEAEAKHRLGEYDGFGTSANLLFGFTGPIDVDTIDTESVQLYEVADPPVLVGTTTKVLDDLKHVEIGLTDGPLKEGTEYAVVVRDSIRDAEGEPITLMPVGHFVKSRAPLFVDGKSQVDAVDDADAKKVDTVREQVGEFLDVLDAGDVLASWTFTTMSIEQPLEKWMAQPEMLAVDPNPNNVTRQSPGEAVAGFALGVSALFNVGDVYNGTISSPVFLDPITRGWRSDGGHSVDQIPFTLTLPRNVSPGTPVPVVIFGHGVMSERRFVLAVADRLAANGYAAIAIDFPFHGDRTYCWAGGPLSLPDPNTGELTTIEPCEAGTTCQPDGRCADAAGQGNALAKWPIINMYQASGAAFIEVEKIANTRDHFRQTLIDLSSLSRAIRLGDWESSIGVRLKTDKLYYAGQSLGGIIGASFVAFSPEIERAVLNVPGADVVDLFDGSSVFHMQIEAFFQREGVARESYNGYRFMNVARWLMDSTDPQSFADRLTDGHDVMIQMATLDFIIPNEYTQKLADLANLPTRNYVAEHMFIALPIEPEYLRGNIELANFISGDFQP